MSSNFSDIMAMVVREYGEPCMLMVGGIHHRHAQWNLARGCKIKISDTCDSLDSCECEQIKVHAYTDHAVMPLQLRTEKQCPSTKCALYDFDEAMTLMGQFFKENMSKNTFDESAGVFYTELLQKMVDPPPSENMLSENEVQNIHRFCEHPHTNVEVWNFFKEMLDNTVHYGGHPIMLKVFDLEAYYVAPVGGFNQADGSISTAPWRNRK